VILLDAGVVRTDVRVDVAHRSRSDATFAELRAFLLDELGVDEESRS
jgi:sulfonate transport system ATP-binding protein